MVDSARRSADRSAPGDRARRQPRSGRRPCSRSAAEFGVIQTVTMCPLDDIVPLRDKFGDRLVFNGHDQQEEPSTTATTTPIARWSDFWSSASRSSSSGRRRAAVERGLFIDAPWRIEAVKRPALGRRAPRHGPRRRSRCLVPHHVRRSRQVRHQGGSIRRPGTDDGVVPRHDLDRRPHGRRSEHPDHLEALLEKYPHFYIDTSATKWQVREVSPRPDAHRD